jgi:hypothetical protein
MRLQQVVGIVVAGLLTFAVPTALGADYLFTASGPLVATGGVGHVGDSS